jgi:hypothetical protein
VSREAYAAGLLTIGYDIESRWVSFNLTSGAGGTSQSLSDGRVATQAVIDLAMRATPCKARVTRLLGRATQKPLEDGIRRGYISPTETMSRPIELLDLQGGKEIVNNKNNFSAEERPADYQRQSSAGRLLQRASNLDTKLSARQSCFEHSLRRLAAYCSGPAAHASRLTKLVNRTALAEGSA